MTTRLCFCVMVLCPSSLLAAESGAKDEVAAAAIGGRRSLYRTARSFGPVRPTA
jgi:hypothetical protein